MFLNVLIYTMLAYGITNVVVYGSIFDGIRRLLHNKYTMFLHTLLSCPLCFSFWVGVALGLTSISYTLMTPINLISNTLPQFIYLTLCGFFTSGAVWLVFKIEDRLIK